MPRENKIVSRKRHALARENGLYSFINANINHASIRATHISHSGYRYQFPVTNETLVGKTIEVKGYRPSYEQVILGCDGCHRSHSVKSEHIPYYLLNTR